MTTARWSVLVAAGVLAAVLAGCATPSSAVTRSAPAGSVGAADPAVATALAAAKDYLTGAVYDGNPGRGEADYTGLLRVDDQFGGRDDGSVADVRVSGTPGDDLAVTIRRTSTDAGRTMDVLHRPDNSRRDYVLVGSDYKAVAPTSWVTVPAEFGRGIGCGMPSHGLLCDVVDDLIDNQGLDDPLPTNAVTRGSGTITVTSAITVRQALDLRSWTFASAVKPLLGKASTDELDHTLVTVTLVTADASAPVPGRVSSLRFSGSFTVGGTPATSTVVWTEGRDQALMRAADKIPIPSRALYTPLTDAQVKKLAALEDSLY